MQFGAIRLTPEVALRSIKGGLVCGNIQKQIRPAHHAIFTIARHVFKAHPDKRRCIVSIIEGENGACCWATNLPIPGWVSVYGENKFARVVYRYNRKRRVIPARNDILSSRIYGDAKRVNVANLRRHGIDVP